jgi:hypothetical protein
MRITPQQQRAYLLHRDISRGDGVHEGAAASTVRHRTCSSDTVYIFTMNLTMSIEFGLHTACDGRTNGCPSTVDFRSSGVVITVKRDDQAVEHAPASHKPNYNTASARS